VTETPIEIGYPVKKTPTKPEPEWITIHDAAQRKNVSTLTIRRWITAGRIYAERLGPRLIRVDAASLDNLGTPLQHVGRR
jgi:excisionase family DNA binding protein